MMTDQEDFDDYNFDERLRNTGQNIDKWSKKCDEMFDIHTKYNK